MFKIIKLLTKIIVISNTFLAIPPTFAVERPKLIEESFYANHSESRDYDPYDFNGKDKIENIWHGLLLRMDNKNIAPLNARPSFSSCRYESALTVLQQIRDELGVSTPYQKIWAKNQDAVFSACDQRRQNSSPPKTVAAIKNLPQRAQSDFLYQLASWHFYHGKYDEALALYQQVENNPKAPLQAYAAYMILRSLKKQGRANEAYEKIDKILANNTFKAIHTLAANYKFIIMNDSDWPGITLTTELATKHLHWLISLTQASPLTATNLKQALEDYFDALEQLDVYFPLYHPKSRSVDWWLTESNIGLSPRMQAVKALAPQLEVVDWFQTHWAYNVFSSDWLWALHQQNHPYWQQNQRIVAHAWSRWRQGDGGEWLQLAIKRVHPQDPLAVEIVQAANPYLASQWQGETQIYQEWLFDLWENLIRIHLGRKDYLSVIALIERHADFKDLLRNNNFPSSHHKHDVSLEQSLRWLVYTGETDSARQLLKSILQLNPHAFNHWRILLATNWSETVAALYTPDKYGWNDWKVDTGKGVELWEKIANLLPSKDLFSLANNPQLPQYFRKSLARAALTRAFLLKSDKALIDQYAVLVAKYHPAIREHLLTSISQHQQADYVDFMLRMPRFRPQPFTDVAASDDDMADLITIDTHNHKDNNWWCQFDRQALENNLFQTARILPYGNQIFDGVNPYDHRNFKGTPELETEVKPYLEKQKALMEQHPYHQQVNPIELSQLEGIPDAPQYLSEAVISREIEIPFAWNFWYPDTIRNQHAANLHHAVRTTRYGCTGHGPSSKRAFVILQKQYSDTVWAKATPYWFK